MRLRKRRHTDLQRRAEDAQAEALRSQQRLEAIRQQVIRPLTEHGDLFADWLRESLIPPQNGS
jgi:hypothetical protein